MGEFFDVATEVDTRRNETNFPLIHAISLCFIHDDEDATDGRFMNGEDLGIGFGKSAPVRTVITATRETLGTPTY